MARRNIVDTLIVIALRRIILARHLRSTTEAPLPTSTRLVDNKPLRKAWIDLETRDWVDRKIDFWLGP